MGKRQVFYDNQGNEIASYPMENGDLYLEIKNETGTAKIVLNKVDAMLFIMDLYRMRKHLE